MKILGSIVLLVVAIPIATVLWQLNFITVVVPEEFSGPIGIVQRQEGIKPDGFWKWKSYKIDGSGLLVVSDNDPFFDWHSIQAKSEGKIRNRNLIELGTHYVAPIQNEKDRDERGITFLWIGTQDEVDGELLKALEAKIRKNEV